MPHILRSYDEELRALKDGVTRMGSQALSALEKSLHCLIDRNLDFCDDVVAGDEVIDQQEKKVDEQGMGILLRFNPVASDLRHVLSSLNICRSLERIGDHAVIVAKRAREIFRAGELDEIRLVEPLFVEAQKIVAAALTSYSDRDERVAHRVIDMDIRVDEINKALSKTLSARIGERVSDVDALLHLLFVCRSLERMGDLAVDIAKDVVFATSAEDIRHT